MAQTDQGDFSGNLTHPLLDEDGDTDLLASVWNESKITWYPNNGSESFSSQNVSTGRSFSEEAISISYGDVDGDAFPDYGALARESAKMADLYEREERVTVVPNDLSALKALIRKKTRA